MKHYFSFSMILMLTACYANYPSKWAAINDNQQTCSNFNGIYHNNGSSSRFAVVKLSPRVFQNETYVDLAVEKIKINLEDGVLKFTAYTDDEELLTQQYLLEQNEYQCNAGKIYMSYFVADILGVRKNRIVLSKSVDEALIVDDIGEGLGFYMIPIIGSEWLRFESYSAK